MNDSAQIAGRQVIGNEDSPMGNAAINGIRDKIYLLRCRTGRSLNGHHRDMLLC